MPLVWSSQHGQCMGSAALGPDGQPFPFQLRKQGDGIGAAIKNQQWLIRDAAEAKQFLLAVRSARDASLNKTNVNFRWSLDHSRR